MKRLLLVAFSLLCIGFLPSPVGAVLPDEVLPDPVLEARAREISQELRCVVCQNQSIDDSNADLARDMRVLVRDRLVAGDTNDQVKEYLVARYGNFVLLRPPVQTDTLLLWLGPVLFLFAAFTGFAFYLRNAKEEIINAPRPLSSGEEALLKRVKENAI